MDRVNSYICTCLAGYIGSRCETGRFPFGYDAIFKKELIKKTRYCTENVNVPRFPIQNNRKIT